jgi:hypothetical protein
LRTDILTLSALFEFKDIIELLYFLILLKLEKTNSAASQFMEEIPLASYSWIRKNRTKKRKKKREPGEIRITMNMCRTGSCKVGCGRAAVVAIPPQASSMVDSV